MLSRTITRGILFPQGRNEDRSSTGLFRRQTIFLLTSDPSGIIFNHMVKRSYHLDLVFSALSDPTRRKILEHLARGEASVQEIAEPYDMSLPAVSKHLRVLEDAGLVTREREGRLHRMSLNSKPLREATAWLERYRAFWEGKFDALEKFLDTSRR